MNKKINCTVLCKNQCHISKPLGYLRVQCLGPFSFQYTCST